MALPSRFGGDPYEVPDQSGHCQGKWRVRERQNRGRYWRVPAGANIARNSATGVQMARGNMARGNMARLPSIVALAAVLGLPLALGGCIGAVVVGGMAAAAGGGYVVGQERGADGLASDFAITTDIRQTLAKTDPKLDAAVTVTVYDGRVLLTGQVPAPEMKMAAVQACPRESAGARGL